MALTSLSEPSGPARTTTERQHHCLIQCVATRATSWLICSNTPKNGGSFSARLSSAGVHEIRPHDERRMIELAVRELGLADRPIEMHVSLRSFGRGGDGSVRCVPEQIVEGARAAGCTVLAITMAPDIFGVAAPLDDRPACNGIVYAAQDVAGHSPDVAGVARLYDWSSIEVSEWLGGFSAHVAARSDRIRCRYPAGEFAAVGRALLI